MAVYNFTHSSSHIARRTPRSTTLCIRWKLLIVVGILTTFYNRQKHFNISAWRDDTFSKFENQRSLLGTAKWLTVSVRWHRYVDDWTKSLIHLHTKTVTRQLRSKETFQRGTYPVKNMGTSHLVLWAPGKLPVSYVFTGNLPVINYR